MKYRILAPHTFRVDDGSVKGAGEIIELSEDTAALHAGKVEPVEDTAQPSEEHPAQ